MLAVLGVLAARKATLRPAAALVPLLSGVTVGVLAVRSTADGVMLIGALVCLVVCLTDPRRMVWIALFLSFASLPTALQVAKEIGPVLIYPHQAAVLAAIACLIPLARLRFVHFAVAGLFALAVTLAAAAGLAAGHDPVRVAREVSFLFEMVAGMVLAVVIIRIGYVRESIRALVVVLWFSAAILLIGSLTGLQLAGRAENLQSETGAPAIRLLTVTQTPALAVLVALVSAQILGRVRTGAWLALGPPVLVVILLSFARHVLIAVAVGAVVALVIGFGWAAIRRSTVLVTVVVAASAVAMPAALFLLQRSAAGSWLADQLDAFSHRVIGGVSTTALATDSSTLARVHENDSLWRAVGDAPFLGHGLGYAYQLPFGRPGTFSATLGTTYAHNFYLWWLAKAGLVGMVVFAVFALVPMARALHSVTAAAKVSAAVSAGMLAICVVNPLPLEPSSALALGLVLGAALTFSEQDRVVPKGMSGPPAPSISPSIAGTNCRW